MLTVEKPVERDDGRFYVPVDVDKQKGGLSHTVFRVASDAFETLEDAVAYANDIVWILNNVTRDKISDRWYANNIHRRLDNEFPEIKQDFQEYVEQVKHLPVLTLDKLLQERNNEGS